MGKVDAIFFDFDGVILDSVDIKTQAFSQMFEQYGEDVRAKVVDYHLKHGGVSRFKKFKHFYNVFLSKEITEEEIQKLSDEFSYIVKEKVAKADFIKGVYETLEECHNKNIDMYIISGTPESEIREIVKLRGLSKYFKDVKGSPLTKIELAAEVFESNSYNPKNCVFIGDALSDLECANHYHMNFLGIVKNVDKNIFPKDVFVKTYVDINSIIK